VGENLTSKGGDLTRVSLPVRIFEPRSYLERVLDGFCFAPVYLRKAAKTKDPVERMKWVVTFMISGLHNTCDQRKPFNPILGETFQATFEDGTQIFCEQSSHHPPVTNWQLIGPSHRFHFYGAGEWWAGFKNLGNTVRGHQKGQSYVDFKDGTQIEFNLPQVICSGFLWGDRIIEYEGLARFEDKKKKLRCDVTISPPTGGWFSGWFGKSTKLPTDYLRGEIYRVDENAEGEKGEVLSTLEGSWLAAVEFDGESFWDWKEPPKKHKPIGVPDPLPSDSRFREDLVNLKKGDLDAATESKWKLEQAQRRDKELRTAGAAREGASSTTAENGNDNSSS
jgi:hypothetical protein